MSALQKQIVTLRLGGGVETKLDGKVVPTTKLLALENGIFTRGVTVAKRHGYESLPTVVLGQVDSYDTRGVRGLASRQLAGNAGEILLFTDDRSHSFVEGADAWSDTGVVLSVGQSDRAMVKSNSAQTAGDYASTNGVAIVAWEDSRGGVYFAVVEDDGGRITMAPSQVSATARRPRCVRIDDKLAVLWMEPADSSIKMIVVDPSTPNRYDKTRFPIVLVADLDPTTPGFDAAFVDRSIFGASRDGASIAWNSVDGIRVGWIDPSGVIGSPVTGWPSALTIVAGAVLCSPAICPAPWAPRQWAVAWGEADRAYVTWVDGEAAHLSAQFAQVSLTAAADPNIVTCAWRYKSAAAGDDTIDVWWEERADPVRNSIIKRRSVSKAGVLQSSDSIGLGGELLGVSLASKGWSDPPDPSSSTRSASYVNVLHDVPLFGVYMCLRHDGTIVARSLSGSASHAQGYTSHGVMPPAYTPGVTAPYGGSLPSVTPNTSMRSYRWTTSSRTLLVSANDDQYTADGLRLVEYDFGDTSAHQTAQVGGSIYLGGACPMLYDGLNWIEASFHFAVDWEDGEVLHTNGNPGGLIENGTRDYVFWPEYVTATGEVIRGPVSKPYTVTISGSDDKTTFAIPSIGVTRMSVLGPIGRANCSIAVGRTVNGDATVYYRCSEVDPASAPINSISSLTVSFTDVLSDTELLTREPIYTNGGIPSNDPTPSTLIIAAGKNRLFTTDPSEPGFVRHTQELAEGYAAEWSPELLIGVDSFGGPVTAIAVLDDAVVIFKRGKIYFVSGPGPLADPSAGAGSFGWSPPSLITSDVGCVSQRSLAVTPAGLVFQSAKGIYMLDRSHQVTYVGAPVEAYNGQTIVRATLIGDTTQVRFLTSSGSTLLYDYFFDQWSTFTNHEGLDGVLVGVTSYHYLRTDGRVFREIPDPTAAGASADAGVHYPLVMETAWIHLQQQLQGMQRIWRLMAIGNWRSPHVLRMQYRVDYQGDWSSWQAFDATSSGGGTYGSGPYGSGVYGGAISPAYQWRWYIGVRCQAIQFRFSDYTYVGQAGPAFELTELLIEGGVVGQMAKISASRSG